MDGWIDGWMDGWIDSGRLNLREMLEQTTFYLSYSQSS
jgi:hypothetical protein